MSRRGAETAEKEPSWAPPRTLRLCVRPFPVTDVAAAKGRTKGEVGRDTVPTYKMRKHYAQVAS